MSNSSRKSQSVQSFHSDGTLPPVSPRLCSCDVHGGRGQFVDHKIQDIEKFIFEEVEKLNDGFYNSKKNRFTVFRKSFEMLIEESVSFKPLLSEINAEYLNVMEAVEKGEHQKSYITRDLKRVIAEKGTLDNYQERIADLQSKVEKIKRNNEELKEQIEQLKKDNEESIVKNSPQRKPSKQSLKHSRLFLPGLEIEEQTDLPTLSSTLARLQADVKEAQENIDIKFRGKDQKGLLQMELQRKETFHQHVTRYNKGLRDKVGKLNVAVEAAKSSLTSEVRKQSVFDVVLKALDNYKKIEKSKRRDPLQQLFISDEDDPLKKKESERLLSYIGYFNDLFDFGQYDAAAIHAASSPKGILRTCQAMQKFKEIEMYGTPKSPLFLFCEALMTTSIDKGDSSYLKLTAEMSVECIACALKESGISLAIYWLNQPCITLSPPLAGLLSRFCKCVDDCLCQCQALAEGIFKTFGLHRDVALALARQGKHRAVIEYGRTHGSFTITDYQAILENNPSVQLAASFLQAKVRADKNGVAGLSFCSIVQVLLELIDQTVLVKFLEHVQSKCISDSKGVRYSISDLIYIETASDGMDGHKWQEVVDLCYNNGHGTLALEILSTLLVRQALNHAAISSSLDYIS